MRLSRCDRSDSNKPACQPVSFGLCRSASSSSCAMCLLCVSVCMSLCMCSMFERQSAFCRCSLGPLISFFPFKFQFHSQSFSLLLRFLSSLISRLQASSKQDADEVSRLSSLSLPLTAFCQVELVIYTFLIAFQPPSTRAGLHPLCSVFVGFT